MDTSVNRVVEHQRQALDFMLDTLGLRQAWEEVSHSPETQAAARTIATLETESDAALRAVAIRERVRRDSDREPDDI